MPTLLVDFRLCSLSILLVLTLVLVASCGGDTQGNGLDSGTDTDADSDTDTDVDSDTDSDGDTDYDSGPDSGPGASLTGKWAQLVNVTIIQEIGIPLVPGDQWIASRNWYLVDVTTDGEGNLTSHERLCALKLKVRACGLEIGTNTSAVSQNFIDHIPVLERHVTVDSHEPGTEWTSDIVYEARGANLCNGECDPGTDSSCSELPANGSASSTTDAPPCTGDCTDAQCDQDEDGHPGITNILTGLLNCETYASQRWWARFDGQIVDADTIAGPIVDNFSEQTVLAATGICDTGSPDTRAEDCPQHQYFKMVRLTDGATCEDVLELTDCDEDPATCDSNTVLPLDPNADLETDCTDECE